jgi:hypothetical protein
MDHHSFKGRMLRHLEHHLSCPGRVLSSLTFFDCSCDGIKHDDRPCRRYHQESHDVTQLPVMIRFTLGVGLVRGLVLGSG